VPAVTVVIPVRYGSTRFPGKALANETGKTLVQHVYERAQQATRVGAVVVATDDERIRAAVASFGGRAVMTSTDHPNGTSRIAEAAAGLDSDIIVNVQGDEPEIEPALIDVAIEALERDAACVMSTVGSPFAADEDPADPNIVKVVADRAGRAMLFSRAPIPHFRDADAATTLEGRAGPYKHVGLYVYRRAFLGRYVELPPTPLEQAESLEQLRVLEHGERIAVAIAVARHHGIDTPAQYAAFVARERARHG
jgi:3-deoxy-manno-octulosonate cytidylyltransferase (CMP-KDO synthetase)